MKSNRLIQRGFATVALLLFLQKNGVELYLHSRLHVKNYQQIPSSASKSQVYGVSCSCVDDFLMPFAEADAGFTPVAVVIHQVFIFQYAELVPDHFQFFNSLRAPPAQSF